MLVVNCKHVGWPDLPQSLHETNSSEPPVFLFSLESPRQKSQYGLGGARSLFASAVAAADGTSSASPGESALADGEPCDEDVAGAVAVVSVGGAVVLAVAGEFSLAGEDKEGAEDGKEVGRESIDSGRRTGIGGSSVADDVGAVD